MWKLKWNNKQGQIYDTEKDKWVYFRISWNTQPSDILIPFEVNERDNSDIQLNKFLKIISSGIIHFHWFEWLTKAVQEINMYYKAHGNAHDDNIVYHEVQRSFALWISMEMNEKHIWYWTKQIYLLSHRHEHKSQQGPTSIMKYHLDWLFLSRRI